MGFITSVVVMTTRTTFKNVLYIIFSIYLAKVRAQSGDDDDQDVDFMSDEGKSDYAVDRFNDDDKGLEYYSDYDNDSSDTNSMDDVVDMLADYGDEKDFDGDDDLNYYDTYGSGDEGGSDEEMERRLEQLESLDPMDADEDNLDLEVSFDPNVKGSIWSGLGVEDNAGHYSRGVTEPGPNTFVNIMDFELDLLSK